MSQQSVSIPITFVRDQRVSAAAQRLYSALAVVGGARAKRGEPFEAPIVELQRALGLAGWSIGRRVFELEEAGYVVVERERRSSAQASEQTSG
jgi:hypothetical protein